MHLATLQFTGALLLALSLFISTPANNACESGFAQHVSAPAVSLIVLGTVQDGGSPHIGCARDCCQGLFENPDPHRKVVSLGVVDHQNQKSYIFEATPDFPAQMRMLREHRAYDGSEVPDGIFLSHAHIGHYTGLMYLGKEAMHGDKVPVFAMPRMKSFLVENGPWSQLVAMENIAIEELSARQPLQLTPNLQVTPFIVPHRDEYSETVGFLISGPVKKALFIPDIDKWGKWDQDIEHVITDVDYAFVDATFYDGEELNNRNIEEIPHPFVVESMRLLEQSPTMDKAKVHFIHFNHTNALLDSTSAAFRTVRENGFNIAEYGDVLAL